METTNIENTPVSIDGGKFCTSDLYLASYLISRGCKYTKIGEGKKIEDSLASSEIPLLFFFEEKYPNEIEGFLKDWHSEEGTVSKRILEACSFLRYEIKRKKIDLQK